MQKPFHGPVTVSPWEPPLMQLVEAVEKFGAVVGM